MSKRLVTSIKKNIAKIDEQLALLPVQRAALVEALEAIEPPAKTNGEIIPPEPKPAVPGFIGKHKGA